MLMWRLCKISITPTVRQNTFLLRKIPIVEIPKSMVLVIIFRVFMWLISLINSGPQKIIHLQCFEMVSKKGRDHLLQARWTMELLLYPLILPRDAREKKLPRHVKIPNEKNCLYTKTQYDNFFDNG